MQAGKVLDTHQVGFLFFFCYPPPPPPFFVKLFTISEVLVSDAKTRFDEVITTKFSISNLNDLVVEKLDNY